MHCEVRDCFSRNIQTPLPFQNNFHDAPAFGTPCWNFPPWYNQLAAVDQCCHPRPAGSETLWSVGSFPCQWAQWLGLSHWDWAADICLLSVVSAAQIPQDTLLVPNELEKERKKEKLWLLHLWHFSSFSKKLYVAFSQETLSELSPYDACIHCCVWLWGLGLICCLTHCNLAQVISGHKIIAPNVHD